MPVSDAVNDWDLEPEIVADIVWLAVSEALGVAAGLGDND